MSMNFFKKVMTFFSIIWNTILWRRTVKDKKFKSVDKGARGKNAPYVAERLYTEEEAGKGFVDVPLGAPSVGADTFQVDSESDINLHVPMIDQHASELISPIVAQSLNFAGINTISLMADTAEAQHEKPNIVSDSYAGYDHVEQLNGGDLPERDDLLVNTNTKGLVSVHTDLLRSENIVEAVILESCPPVNSYGELKEESEIHDEDENAVIDTESKDLVLPSKISDGNIEGHTADVESSEQVLEVPLDSATTDSCNDLGCNETNQDHQEELLCSSFSQEVVSQLIKLEEGETDVHQIDTTEVFDKVMSSDGDYVPHEVFVEEKLVVDVDQGLLLDDNWILLESSNEVDEEKPKCETKLDTSVIVIPDLSLVDMSLNQEDGISHSNEVKMSISSVKLSDARCGESFSDLPSLDRSTNYMVRSDSLVNFLPNTHSQGEPESAPNVLTTAELSYDTVWIEDKVNDLEYICTDGASATLIDNAEQSCLEEIMCTSTGILKLSDSGGDDLRDNSIDAPVQPDDLTPENKNEEVDESPITANDLHLPGVFRYNGRGVTGYDAKTEPVNQSNSGNFRTKTQKLDFNGKELRQRIHTREESNEHSSTKSENDTLDNVDELSYDVNINIIQGENQFHDNISSSKEEFEIDPVVVLIRTRPLDESAGTGSNVPSLPKSEIHFQVGNFDRSHLDGNIRTSGSQRLQEHISRREADLECPHIQGFPEQFLPRGIPADYNGSTSTISGPPFDINDNSILGDGVPLVSVGMTSYYEASKWQQPISCTAPDDAAPVDYDAGCLRLFSKNESLLYTHMGQESKTANDSDNPGSKVGSEFYPFIDGASYLFGIPEEIRKNDYFNPCVGTAPSSRTPSKPAENLKCETLKAEAYKLNAPDDFMAKGEQSWSMTQRPLQHELFPTAEAVESKFGDGCYRSGMKVQVDGENVQRNVPQCRVWNAPDQLLPTDKYLYHNGFDTNADYSHAPENIQPHQLDFVPADYLQNTAYDNNQNTVCNTTNGYEFINPYGVGFFPMLDIPFCLPDPFVTTGQVPPFVFPIGPVNVEQDEGPPADLEADESNSLYPLSPHPYWVGFQADDNGSRSQTDVDMNNEISPVDMDRQYTFPQVYVNEIVGVDEDATDECPIPDPYFQLAENTSLHSVKSKAESFNGSLFCESLRSILSSHNAESDNVIPSFSRSSVRCYSPSLVVRSRETSLSNDSLPSIIVEGSYSKSVDEDYPAKEKFMNDVNTALNESIMDHIQEDLDECPTSFLGRGDFGVELMETTDTVTADIERTLQGIVETNVASQFDDDDYMSHSILSLEVGEDMEDVRETNKVNELLIEILDSVIDNVMKTQDQSCDKLVFDQGGSEFMTFDDNDVETVNVFEDVEERIVAQHMIHLEANYVNFDDVLRLVSDDDDEVGADNESGECIDSNEVVNVEKEEESILVCVGTEVSLCGSNDESMKVDCEHTENNNQVMRCPNGTHSSARVDMGDGGSACDEGNEVPNVGFSATEQNMIRKRRRNGRRKKKETTMECETMAAAEIGIGDGTKHLEVPDGGFAKEESTLQEVAHFEHSTVPEGMEGPAAEDAKAGDEDRCREDQGGEPNGSVGNSSNNRKRRNRRKKRKN